MEDGAKLAELFSLAQKKDQHGSLGRHFPDAAVKSERNVSATTKILYEQDLEQSFSQDMLNYSYGL